jgi:hypothetical protein
MDQNTAAAKDARDAVLKRMLGAFYAWQPPDLDPSVGPCDPAPFTKFDERRLAMLQAFGERLAEFAEDQIAALLDPSTEPTDGAIATWLKDLRRDLDRLKQTEPPWHAGGFGHPAHRADFDYWSKMATFSIDELLCLSLGIEPASFDKDSLARLEKKEKSANLWPSLIFLLRRKEQLERRFGPYSISPNDFLEWRDQVAFDAHPDFVRLLRLYHAGGKQPTSQAGSGLKADKREIDKIALLFTAMAMELYGYQPKASRSQVPKEIADRAASLGLSVTDDTVRKYLKLGASFLPEGWDPFES